MSGYKQVHFGIVMSRNSIFEKMGTGFSSFRDSSGAESDQLKSRENELIISR